MDVDLSVPPAEGVKLAPLGVLAVLSEARAEHGLRAADYTRYRHYCAKRAHRLRQLAHLTHADAEHQSKPKPKDAASAPSRGSSRKKKNTRTSRAQQSVSASQLGGNTFTRVKASTADITDHTLLLLFLFETERHWAHAQALKAEQIHGVKVNPKQIAARAKRAVQWGKLLHAATQQLGKTGALDARSQLEAGAYANLVRASASLDGERYQSAVAEYAVVRRALSVLAAHAPTAKDEAYAHSFLDQAEPGMRYAAYQLEIEESDLDVVEAAVVDEDTLQQLFPKYNALAEAVEGKGTESRGPTEVTFRAQTIPIRNPELVVAIQTLDKEREALGVALDQESEDQAAAKHKAETKAHAKSTAPIKRHTHAERNARRKAAGAHRFRGGATTERTQLDPFDRALAAAGDAEALASQLVDDEKAALSRSQSSRYAAATAPLAQAQEYLAFVLGMLRVQRNAHLVARVEHNARLRQRRAEALMGLKLQRAQSGKRTAAGKSGKRKPRVASVLPHTRQTARRSKKATLKKRQGKAVFHRRPARSGSRKLRRTLGAERIARLRTVTLERAVRRRARALPGIIRLLEGIETSLAGLSRLELVEADPDLSSLIDAKLFLCRANLTAHLADAYAASKAEPQAVVLLESSMRFVKQAGDALQIAQGVDEENALLPPLVKAHLLDTRLTQLNKTKRAYQVALVKNRLSNVEETSATGALTDSLSGEVLRSTTARYVTFDPVLLRTASEVPGDVLDQAEREASTALDAGSDAPPAQARAAGIKDSIPPSASAVEEEEDEFAEAPEADDSGDEFAEAHEGPASPVQGHAVPAPRKKGWLSSILGR